jgi:hypothetical protein
MATWQFDLHLLPRSKIIGRYACVPARLSETEFYTMDWWSGVILPIDYESLLGPFLPRYTSWSKDISCWGAEGSDLIEIFFDNQAPEEIFIRIDARKLDIRLLEKISDFARLCDCLLFLDESGKLIEPDSSGLYQEIEKSSAYKFVTNLVGFLDEYSKQLEKTMLQDFIATGILGDIYLGLPRAKFSPYWALQKRHQISERD